MDNPLRVGVVGLGTKWRRRYRPALLSLQRHYRVIAVYDQVHEHAQREAKRLECDPAPGVVEMLGRNDLDALLLLDKQWHGLWPLEMACRLGKPVFCACPIECDDAHADAVRRQVAERRLPVMMEMLPRFAPAILHLRQLLADQLGDVHLVAGDVLLPERLVRCWSPADLLQQAGLGTSLLDCCSQFVTGDPAAVVAYSAGRCGAAGVLMEFADGKAVVINVRTQNVSGRRQCQRLAVKTGHGYAEAKLPRRIEWIGKDGHHTIRLPKERPLGQVLLVKFHQAIRDAAPPVPGFDDAHRALTWLRAAARSQREGRRVTL